MPTLLEQAKISTRHKKGKFRLSDEEIELFLGWCNGEIGIAQIKDVTGRKGNTYCLLARCARQYIQENGKK